MINGGGFGRGRKLFVFGFYAGGEGGGVMTIVDKLT